MSNKNKKRIGDIFKSEEEARKDSVDLAKKNLEEEKTPKKPVHKKKKRRLKNTWSRRLFYGPGTLWGAGGSCNHNHGPTDTGSGTTDGGSSGDGGTAGDGGGTV
jgi:hypothetical protein